MPKKAGIGKKSSKLDWKKKRRQEYLEMKQYRYYIFCEGQQTEPLYFAGFKKLSAHQTPEVSVSMMQPSLPIRTTNL